MGNVDIYHSRRTNFQECIYWTRDERTNVGNASQWIMQHSPSGSFYCREISPKYGQFNEIGNGFVFSKNGITLETDDDVHDIKEGDIVMYNGHAWFVDNTQFEVHKKETEFDIEMHYKSIITLRR